MPRRPRLQKGDIVWLNRNAMNTGMLGRARSRLGVVVAVLATVLGELRCVQVRRDGLKGASWYSPAFWRKASNREVLRYARGRPGLKSRKGADR